MQVSVKDLYYEVNNKSLLDNISFDIEQGEFVSILGPNGAGKSTLLRMLSKQLKVTDEMIFLNNRDINRYSFESLARCRAVVEQSAEIMFPFKVWDIVCFGRYPFTGGDINKDDEVFINTLLEETETIELRDRIYNTLSGGEKQRVQLSRALVQLNSPEIIEHDRLLMLDEPIASMDIAHQLMCLQQMEKMSKKGVTVIVILHDINLATRFSDRIFFLKEGKLVLSGTADEVITQDTIEYVYEVPVQMKRHPENQRPVIFL